MKDMLAEARKSPDDWQEQAERLAHTSPRRLTRLCPYGLHAGMVASAGGLGGPALARRYPANPVSKLSRAGYWPETI